MARKRRLQYMERDFLNGMTRVFGEAPTCETEQDLAKTCLAVAQELTLSKYGFVCEIDQEDRFSNLAISDPSWDGCMIPKTKALLKLNDTDIRGMVSNDPASHPAWLRTRKGRAPINSFLGVPLKYGGRAIGMIGLANKKEGYDSADEQAIEALSVSFVEALMRRRAETALRRERDFMARIMETSPVCIIIINRDGQITFANPGAEEVLGVSKDEITKRSYNAPEWHITDYDGNPLADEKLPFQKVIHTGQPLYDMRYAILWPNGRRVLLSINAAPLFDESGHVDGVVSTIEDVTEQVEIAEALRESEEKYRTILGSIEDGYYEVDTAGSFTFFNDSMCTILGYSKDELRGMNYKHYTAQEDIQAVYQAFNRVYTTGTPARVMDHGIRRKDGIKGHVQLSVSLMKDAEGQRIGFRGVLRDTTERKRAEKTINEERNLLRTVIDNVPDFIYVKDTEGRYLVSNNAFARYLGKTTPDEVVGKTAFDLLPEELASGFYADDQEVIRSGQPLLNKEDHLVDKEGKTIWNLTTKVSLRDSSGNIKGLVGIDRNITHRKRSEEQLKRHAAQLTALHQTSAAVSSRLTLEEIFETVVRGLSEAFDYRLVGIYLLEDGMLELKAHVGYSPPDPSLIRIPLEKGVIGRTARTGQPQLVTKVEEDPDFFYGAPGITSEVCVPLKRGDEVLGVLNVESDKADKSLDTSDLELVTLLSNYILIAIENARLYDAAQRELAERRQAEQALRQSEERYRTLVQNIPIGVYRATPGPKGKFLMANPTLLKMFGLDSEEELRKMAAADVYMNRKDGKVFSDNLLSRGSAEGVELPLRTKDGEVFWGSVTARVVYDETGKNPHFDCTIMDITERKKAEEKIKEYSSNLARMVEKRTRELNRALYDTEQARDRIDAILKSVADGLIVTDIHNRVILMNRAAEDLLGARLSEVIERSIDFAIEDKTLRDRIKTTLDKKEREYQFDFELPGQDKTRPRIMRARTSVIEDKAGTQTGIVTIMHDVTYEREVSRMKSEFISTAAHELRTPLTSMQGLSEILLTRADITEEEKKRFLSYINKQSVNLANIINDLLDISRIESGRGFSLRKAPCNIADIIKDVVTYFQDTSPDHSFDIILPEEPTELVVDKNKMEQVLENILSNAVKYSPDGGLIRVNGALLGDHYQVSIEDGGIGMSPEQLEKIFDRFYRADASNTAIPGTGLGMSIVEYIIEAHGGKVWVESELGKGTTVRCTIPIGRKCSVKRRRSRESRIGDRGSNSEQRTAAGE